MPKDGRYLPSRGSFLMGQTGGNISFSNRIQVMATPKNDQKIAPKTGKKVSPKKPHELTDSTLDIAQGGQVVGTYVLTPKVPKDGKICDWKLVNTASGNATADLLTVRYSQDSSPIECDLERAVLVIDMIAQDKKGNWRFIEDGINICNTEGDQAHDIYTDIINKGKTLLIYIHSLELGQDKINYSFVASYTDAASGQTFMYESKDPTILVKRP